MPDMTAAALSEKDVHLSDKKVALESGTKETPKPTEGKVAEVEAKFPPIDKLGSHFYDNEAGTFWVGIVLKDNDPLVLTAMMDAQKLPMLNALMDFSIKQARRNQLLGKPRQGGLVDRLAGMFKK